MKQNTIQNKKTRQDDWDYCHFKTRKRERECVLFEISLNQNFQYSQDDTPIFKVLERERDLIHTLLQILLFKLCFRVRFRSIPNRRARVPSIRFVSTTKLLLRLGSVDRFIIHGGDRGLVGARRFDAPSRGAPRRRRRRRILHQFSKTFHFPQRRCTRQCCKYPFSSCFSSSASSFSSLHLNSNFFRVLVNPQFSTV